MPSEIGVGVAADTLTIDDLEAGCRPLPPQVDIDGEGSGLVFERRWQNAQQIFILTKYRGNKYILSNALITE